MTKAVEVILIIIMLLTTLSSWISARLVLKNRYVYARKALFNVRNAFFCVFLVILNIGTILSMIIIPIDSDNIVSDCLLVVSLVIMTSWYSYHIKWDIRNHTY